MENLRLYLQNFSFRGDTISYTIKLKRYVFRWDPTLATTRKASLGAYAMQPANLKEVDDIIESMLMTKMFTPGLTLKGATRNELMGIAETPVVAPAAPSKDTPAAPAAVEAPKVEHPVARGGKRKHSNKEDK